MVIWGCVNYTAMFVWGIWGVGGFWGFSVATFLLAVGCGVAGSIDTLAPHGNLLTHAVVFFWASWAVNSANVLMGIAQEDVDKFA